MIMVIPTPIKCQVVAILKVTIKYPRAAPAKPAMLHTPWKKVMIDRLYNDCTLTDCAFNDRLNKLRDEPKQNNSTASCQVCVAKPSKASVILYTMAPKNIILRLLKRLSKLPVTGRVSIKPAGIANSTAPNCASFRCKCL